jgi:hypothetical protein
MDGHHSDLVGAQNSAYRFARPEIFFPETNAANHRDEPQALTKGLSEEERRGRMAPQRPQTSLSNHSPLHKIEVYGQYIPPAPGFYSFLCGEAEPRVAGYLR